jgi:hypothetical protein
VRADLCELGMAMEKRRSKLISCLGVIYFVPRSLHRHVLLGLFRSLLPGGSLVLGLANTEMDNVPIDPNTGLLCSQFGPEAYVALLQESGFVVQEHNSVVTSQVEEGDTSLLLPPGIGSQVWLAYKPTDRSTIETNLKT